MSVRSSRSAAEAAQRQHPRLRAFHDAMSNSMQAFEKAREWPDLIKCLARVNKVLMKFSHIDHVPMTLTVTKRLAQCLNPVLPGGVHLKTLETYRVILERIGPQRLVQDLSLYSTGLFPLLSYASTRVKPDLLEIYEKYYLTLAKGLLPCLSGFILALLPGLEEGSGEIYTRTLKLLDDTRRRTSIPIFALALWRCVLQCSACRPSALLFITATIPVSGSPDLAEYLPPKRSIAIEAIVAALHDNDVLTQRSMFDLMISHFPLVESIFTKNELTYLVQATLPVILRRETSVNRRFYSWLLGKGTNEEVSSNTPAELSASTLEMIVTSLCQMMSLYATSANEATQPFNVSRTLVERDELRTSAFLSQISLPLIDYAYSYDSESNEDLAVVAQAVLKSAQLFFNQVNLNVVWTALISELESVLVQKSTSAESKTESAINPLSTDEKRFDRIHTVDLIDFALDFLPVHFDNEFSGKNIIQILINTVLKALYSVSWKGAFADLTRTILFVTKLLSSRFSAQHGSIVPVEWELFITRMPLPLPKSIDEMFEREDEAANDIVDAESSVDTFQLQCIKLLFDLFRILFVQSNTSNDLSNDVLRFSDHVLQFANSPNPQFACLGIEVWLRIVQESLKKAQHSECIRITNQLWYLLDSTFTGDIHCRVAVLWSQMYGICPDLCEAVVADAMLNPDIGQIADAYIGYHRFSHLWHLLSPLDQPGSPSRWLNNALSIMLDAVDDSRTPIRIIALEFILESAEYIYRILDPMLLILLCPSTLRSSPDLRYSFVYDTDLTRHTLCRLVVVFSSIHRQTFVIRAGQQTVVNPTILDLLKRHLQKEANLSAEQKFPLSSFSYLEVLFWCALRFVQGTLPADVTQIDSLGNEDVRLSAIELLVQLITSSASLPPSSSNSSTINLRSIAASIDSIGVSALYSLSLSLDRNNNNMQISLLRLLRHVIVDSNRLRSLSGKPSLSASPTFISTVLHGIQKSHVSCSQDQHVLKHWIGFVISILPHLNNSLGSISFSVLTVLCEQIRKVTHGADSGLSCLLYGIREIIHYCLLDIPSRLALAPQLSTVNVTSGNNSSVFGFLGGIFSSSSGTNDMEPTITHNSSSEPAAAAAVQGILPLVVDAILHIWSMLSHKKHRRTPSTASVTSRSTDNNSTALEIPDLIITFLDPLLRESSTLMMIALLLSWDAHSLQHSNGMSVLSDLVEYLPSATPDCIMSALVSIASVLKERQQNAASVNDLKQNSSVPSDTALLHFLDQYIRTCKTNTKLTDCWPRLMQLQRVYSSGPNSNMTVSPPLWLLSIFHEFSLRTQWSKMDPKMLKDVRDTTQSLFSLCSNCFVKGATETVIAEELPRPASLSYRSSIGNEDEDDIPPPSWLVHLSHSAPLTLRLLAIRSFSNVVGDFFRLIWPGNSPEEEERGCSVLAGILPCILLNIDNHAMDQLDYAAAASAFISTFSVNKFKFALKVFRKECWGIFQHNDFFDSSIDSLIQWRKILSQIVTEEPTLMTEQLMGKPINPQVLMFTSHKADVLARTRQMKRLNFMINAGRTDEYARHLPAIVEKLIESLKLEDAVLLHIQVLFCIRILIARVSPEHLTLIWPVVLIEAISILDESNDLDLILEACKFVDLALVLLPSQFYLYQWMFIIDRLALHIKESEPELPEAVPEAIKPASNAEDVEIEKLCNYNSFNCFQPHIRYLGHRLHIESQISDPAAQSLSRRASGPDLENSYALAKQSCLRRPLLTMRHITSASQLKHFHYEVSNHISTQSLLPTPADFPFIDRLLISDFISFADGCSDLITF